MKSRWYEEFFDSDASLDIWQKYVTPEMTRSEVDFLASALNVQAGAQVLDVPCGNGRHCVELTQRGFHTTGVDVSEKNIARARTKAENEGIEVHFIQADMRELPPLRQFDAVFCFGNSFGYLDFDGMRDFLAGVVAVLKPGGRFCIDTWMAAESLLLDLSKRAWCTVDDMYLLVENTYAAEDSRLDTTNTVIFPDGRRDIRESSHWIYTVAEIKRMLASVGLRTLATYGSLDMEPYALKNERLLVVSENVAE